MRNSKEGDWATLSTYVIASMTSASVCVCSLFIASFVLSSLIIDNCFFCSHFAGFFKTVILRTMSSPFPIPQLTYPSPSNSTSNPATFAPSPLSQFVASALASTTLAPGSNGGGTGNTPNLGTMGISPNFSFGLTPSNLSQGPTSNIPFSQLALLNSTEATNAALPAENDGTGLLRGLEQADGVLGRMEELLKEIDNVEKGVFGDGEGIGRLEGLYLECTSFLPHLMNHRAKISLDTQLLLGLLGSSQSQLFGALPILPANEQLEKKEPTAQDLAAWAEERASLEFSRKEALRAGGKAVLDVLRASAAAGGK